LDRAGCHLPQAQGKNMGEQTTTSFPGQAPTPESDMLFLSRAFQLSQIIGVAASLGIADELGDHPKPIKNIAGKIGCDGRMLLRLCRALAAFGIFEVDATETLRPTARSDLLRRDRVPTVYYASLYRLTPGSWQAWASLEQSVRTGEPAFERCFGEEMFAYLRKHPTEAASFDAFMAHSPDDRHTAVVEAIEFSDAKLIVDVGGGRGAMLAAILARFPKVRGLLFDQASVISGAVEVLRPVADRCDVRSGSFFESVPKGGDLYILSDILHDWDDDGCGVILRNVRAAMVPGSRLMIVERVLLGGKADDAINYLSDIEMMVLLRGRERTPTDFETLLAPVGLHVRGIVRTTSPFSVVEAVAL